jgi:23S rRNA pseudouridine1911/1915/1917 synthase
VPLDDSEVLEEPAEESAEDVLHFNFTASKTQKRRIDQFLTERLSWLSRASVQRCIDGDLVKVNGKPTKASYKLKQGDVVDMVAPLQPVHDLIPEPIPLEIIYEDEHFLALNKQANLIVHPARGRWSGTLVNGLVHYGKNWSKTGGEWRPGILHRLDRNTTGIMLVAKRDEAHWRIAGQFENRTIQKKYLAVIHGVPELLSDVIDMPIGRDRYTREKQAVRKLENGGRPAVTKYEIEAIFPRAKGQPHALINLWPKTGRTHQLRVHLAFRKHPIVGDTTYGGQVFEADNFRFDRQALHAHQITFIHPGTFKPMTLTAPVPADFQELVERMEKGV